MSITLKNINATDTISSMVDKINFNFDQLLINGGGIEGPRGVEGYPGMQGNRGEKGETGLQGEQGIRGVHFHSLPLGDETNPVAGTVYWYVQHGLTDPDTGKAIDPNGDEILEGDMIIAYRPESNSSTANNFSDSIWSVIYDDTPSITDIVPANPLNFSITTFWEEYGNPADPSTHKLLRLKEPDDYQLGVLINDYDGQIDISGSQLDNIVNNNIVLLYTEALGANDSEDSPNCGIVFYKNGKTNSPIGDFPRINYIVSSDDTINYLNIHAEKQGIKIRANDDVSISSATKDVLISLDDESNSNFKIIKKVNNEDRTIFHINENRNIVLSPSSIKVTKETDVTDTLLNIESSSDNLNIDIYKNANIKLPENSTLRIGKTGSNYDDPSSASYYQQARINLINADQNGVSSIDIIGEHININGKSSTELYGIEIKNDNTNISALNESNLHKTQIKLNENVLDENDNQTHNINIQLLSPYPGVTKISNIYESYENTIIDYNDKSIDLINSPNKILYCQTMDENYISQGRYQYANCNVHSKSVIRVVNTKGSIHGGSIKFTGTADTSSSKSDITYNFVRIGKLVQCTFYGTIDTSKIFAVSRNSSISHPPIDRKNLTYNEIKFSISSQCTQSNTWPSNPFSPTFQNTSLPTSYGESSAMYALISGEFTGKKEASSAIIPTIAKIALNKLKINLYPPVLQVHYDSDNHKYYTGVKNFGGHITYAVSGTTYEKELAYIEELSNNDISTSGSNDYIKIPSIIVRSMGSGFKNTDLYHAAGFYLTGASVVSQVPLSGYFSYMLDIDDIDNSDYVTPIDAGSEQ